MTMELIGNNHKEPSIFLAKNRGVPPGTPVS